MQTLSWGIIGTGDVAERKSGPALYQARRSELVGVTNRNLAKAESFASRHGGQVFASVAEMLKCDDVDAVYIATPPESHCELTLQCAAAGKHVLCEKPGQISVWGWAFWITRRVSEGQRKSLAYASGYHFL